MSEAPPETPPETSPDARRAEAGSVEPCPAKPHHVEAHHVEAHHVEAGVLARRAAHEADEIRRLVAALERRVEGLAPLAADRDPAVLTSLQSLDHLRQAAAGLSGFLDGLGRALPAGLAVEAAPLVAAVDLRAVSDRLLGRDAAPRADAPPAGEVDLF